MEQMTFTGDPFVDVGGLVVDTLPQKSIEEKIHFATDVYVDRWKGKLDGIFMLSKITNNSVKENPQKQRSGSLAYYFGLTQGKDSGLNGYCRICSKENKLFKARRDNYPLAGSGEFVNFHHFHEEGMFTCGDCLIKTYFLPLSVFQCGDKLMLLQIHNEYTAKLWQEEVILKNLSKIHNGSSEGILKSNLMRPQNALFHFAGKLIDAFEDQPSQEVRLFYFSNFGSKPDTAIYDLPNPVFSFLKRVLKSDFKTEWLYFVKRHYRFRGSVHFDQEVREWVDVKKTETTTLDVQEYNGTNSNTVYDYLLSGKSILRLLCRMHRSEKFPILITITYLLEVREMKQEQISLIRKISEKIIALCEREGDYRKFITPIEGARHAYELRTAILRLVKTHYKNGDEEPFIRFDDYVNYLFPDGQSWYEIRDFLLICLYEKLHELRIEPAQISDIAIADVEEIESSTTDSFND